MDRSLTYLLQLALSLSVSTRVLCVHNFAPAAQAISAVYLKAGYLRSLCAHPIVYAGTGFDLLPSIYHHPTYNTLYKINTHTVILNSILSVHK